MLRHATLAAVSVVILLTALVGTSCRKKSDPDTHGFPGPIGSSPPRIFNRVDLPVPLAPTRPTRSCAVSIQETPSNSTFGPNRLEALMSEIIDGATPARPGWR